ncbi:MAG TPA: GNAT family N-acetyltransferase, partial [Gemmatimonadaceae bacterium]
EAAAFLDLYRAAPPELGFEARTDESHTALFAPRFDMLLFNRVIALGLQTPASETLVASLIDRYRSANIRNFGVQLSPEAQPGALPHWLAGCGLRVRDAWTKVYRSNDDLPTIPTGLRVDRIDASLAERFAVVGCAAHGLPAALTPLFASAVGRPGWHHFMAWDHGTPAAIGALFVQNGVGWLGMGATLPAFRRRGAQGALMALRLREGARLGCRWFVTECAQDLPERPNPSFRNMLRTGFKVAYHRPNLLPPR